MSVAPRVLPALLLSDRCWVSISATQWLPLQLMTQPLKVHSGPWGRWGDAAFPGSFMSFETETQAGHSEDS